MSARATPESFWAHVDRTSGPSGCWLWSGSHFRSGYARVRYHGRDTVAHLVAFELAVGPVPVGAELDHLCRHRWCVNPAHLEPVSPAENQRRIPGSRGSQTACRLGHPLNGDNLLVRRDGRRRCRTCKRAEQRRLRSTPAYRENHATYERARRAERKERVA